MIWPGRLSPHRYRTRYDETVDVLVLHYTAGGGDEVSVDRLFATSSRKASAHCTVGRGGGIRQHVPLDQGAMHVANGRFPRTDDLDRLPDGSGVPAMDGVARFHRRSIGIELCNRGWDVDGAGLEPIDIVEASHRNPHSRKSRWERYRARQISGLLDVVIEIRRRVHSLRWVCGHEDVFAKQIGNTDYRGRRRGSKLDPGPAFPWDAITWEHFGLRRVHFDFVAKVWRIHDTPGTRRVDPGPTTSAPSHVEQGP